MAKVGYSRYKSTISKEQKSFTETSLGGCSQRSKAYFEYYKVDTGNKGGESINGGMLKRQKSLEERETVTIEKTQLR